MASERVPGDRRYSPDHIWVDENGRLGVTAILSSFLPPLTAAYLPAAGTELRVTQPFGELEADKGLYDLYAPCDGVVVRPNPALEHAPSLVNDDCYGSGWILEIEYADAHLMDADDYSDPGRRFKMPTVRSAKAWV